MRVGIGTYTFPWSLPGRKNGPERNLMPPEKLVEAAGALAGIEIAQLCDQTGAEKLDAGQKRELGKSARDRGIVLQLGTRGIDPEHLHLFLTTAVELGCDLVRTILPAAGPGSAYREAGEMLGDILPGYAERKILLSIENHDRNLSADLRRLVEDVGSPWLGICLDPVNSFGIGEDSRRVVETLAPVTNCFHAKDYRVARIDYGLGYVLTGAPAGEGMLAIPDILERFSRLGRSPDIIAEHWTPYQGDLSATLALERAWAGKSAAYLVESVKKMRAGKGGKVWNTLP